MTPVAASLEARLAAVQREARLPSLSACVARGSSPLLVRGFGADPPAPDVQYRIGSITKTFTAVLVLQLRDEGLLHLDDRLEEHLPGTAVGGVRIRELLSHTSGLRREPLGDFWEAVPGPSVEGFVSAVEESWVLLGGQRAWHYSNVAFGLLGALVARLRGVAWGSVLAERVLAPLGLADTSVLPRAPRAVGLRVHPFADAVEPEPMADTGAMGPAGQLWSTPTDLCAFGAFLVAGADGVLPADTVEEMAEVAVMADPQTWTLGFGLGVMTARRGDRLLAGHGGSMPGFGAGLAVDRASGVSAAVCANAWAALDGFGLAAELADVAASSDDGRPVASPWCPAQVPPEVEELLGRWWWRGVAVVATHAEGALHLAPGADPSGPRRARYEADGPDRFVCTSAANRGERLLVERAPSGAVLRLDVGGFLHVRDRNDPAGGP